MGAFIVLFLVACLSGLISLIAYGKQPSYKVEIEAESGD